MCMNIKGLIVILHQHATYANHLLVYSRFMKTASPSSHASAINSAATTECKGGVNWESWLDNQGQNENYTAFV